jgi:two-component system osmolarity sensor histidine kinase EnvZ
VLIERQLDRPVLWVRFHAQGKLYWAAFPKRQPLVPFYLMVWIGIGVSLSIGGAYLIIFRLTQQLRTITKAAHAVGKGEAPNPLAEIGPTEILNLSKGFNQMAADLKKLDDDRRLMLAGISHDLKTPLTHLRIAVELAATHAEPEIAAGMVHDIEDMDTILKQFLDYARDGSEEKPVMGDLNAIVRDVCDHYRSRRKKLKVSLGDIPQFVFRQFAMYRVVTNIVENAVRFGRDGIHVETASSGKEAVVLVADEGPGIQQGEPNEYVKAFARENTSRSESGAGLGLTIVDRIVRTHGGNLRLENRQEGGLLVRIAIPLLR